MTRTPFLFFICVLFCAGLFFYTCTYRHAEQKLEVFSWWTAGGEAEGLESLRKIFMSKNPNVEFINATVAGGAGSNAQAVLATRMQGGSPPDTFQVHAGSELIGSWVAVGAMEPLNFLFEQNDWMSVYPRGLIDIISHNGNIYSVPVNIHRSNVLWYNKSIFKAYGLKPPQTLDDFFKVSEVLADNGITPLALGDNGIWAATHLFENILLGALGPLNYKNLWNGELNWNSEKVKSALKVFVKVLSYINTDHTALSWDGAAQYVIDGKCAMTIMGDWAHGYFKAKGLKPGVDYGWMPSPGTEGSFNMLSDSFGLPKNAPHRDLAVKWLTICGSREGQDAFNPIKGSIPARTDADRTLYDNYSLSAINDFLSNIIVPSCTHGAAASQSWVAKINEIMSVFVAERDVDKAAMAFQETALRYVNK
jgi:glucose/mannose transport system substrate-binding protein